MFNKINWISFHFQQLDKYNTDLNKLEFIPYFNYFHYYFNSMPYYELWNVHINITSGKSKEAKFNYLKFETVYVHNATFCWIIWLRNNNIMNEPRNFHSMSINKFQLMQNFHKNELRCLKRNHTQGKRTRRRFAGL